VGLPSWLCVRRFTPKYILNRAVEKWLPRAIVYRQKRGFSLPIASWTREDLNPLVEETLSEDKLKREGLLLVRPMETG
jgi:asparagine synthase (glutamine-hydrolysing)